MRESNVLFIAEISANHLGSFERAKKIVEAAAMAGATAVKFQTYTAQTMTLDIPEFSVSSNHELWGGADYLICTMKRILHGNGTQNFLLLREN